MYKSAFYATLLQSSSTVMILVDVLDVVVDSVKNGGALAQAAETFNTTQEQQQAVVDMAKSKENQITLVYELVKQYADSASVGASAETSSNINASLNSADQLYYDGIKNLGESVQVASDILQDGSSEGSNG